MKPGDVVAHKNLPGSRAVILRWASEEECPASEGCDLSPFEVEWQVLPPQVRFVKVGQKDMLCLHDLELVGGK